MAWPDTEQLKDGNLVRDERLGRYQVVLPIVISLSAGIVTYFLFNDGKPAVRADVGLVLGILVLLIGLVEANWIEVIRVGNRQTRASADLQSSILGQLQSTKHYVSDAVELDHAILENKTYFSTLRALSGRSLGLEKVRRNFILEQASGHLQLCRIQLGQCGDEFRRIQLLGDVTRSAERYVNAYTHADPLYLKFFWADPTDAILDYYRAHRDALSRNKLQRLERVFIVPDELFIGPTHVESLIIMIRVFNTNK